MAGAEFHFTHSMQREEAEELVGGFLEFLRDLEDEGYVINPSPRANYTPGSGGATQWSIVGRLEKKYRDPGDRPEDVAARDVGNQTGQL